MAIWDTDELNRFGNAKELEISTGRKDGTFRSYQPIWVVRVGDELFIRSWRGRDGSWFKQLLRTPTLRIRARRSERTVTVEEADPGLRDELSQAFRGKYGSGWHVDAMVAEKAAEAAFRLIP